jgi:hypothetical protein
MPKGGVQTNITYSWGSKANPNAWGVFSPGIPLTPVVNEPVRGFDFKPNINATLRPRAYEQFGFPALRAFANVELVRLAIETRKDQFERLDWQVKPVDNKKKTIDDPRIAEVTKFWRKPDGVTPFATFVRQSLEDLLALDAPAFEKRRTRGGALLGLEIVPGDTIHPMVDNTGRRPRAPTDLAFQQVIKGVAWADLTNNDLLYVPRNPRPNHLYGFGPVEQIIVTINTILRRQASQLSYFTEGNVPAGLLNAPDGWDAAKISELQQWFDDRISGNAAEQNKLIWGPAGSAYTAFKSAPVKDEFDEWLARIVAFAFSLPPTPFIRQMNRSTGETDQERALEEGLEPLKLWAKRWIDGIIQDEMGYADLEFAWAKEDSTSAKEQSEIDDRDLKNGSKTLDEVRDARGDESLPNGLGAKPLIYTASGAVTLDSVINPPDPPEQVVVPAPGAPVAAGAAPTAANDAEKPKPAATASKLVKAKQEKTLYVSRGLINADDVIAWAKENGFETTLEADDMHTTVAYSRAEVDWNELGDSFDTLRSTGGDRSLERFDGGAVVLRFDLAELSDRWQEFIDQGASWDFPEYKPHVTLSYAAGDLDLSTIAPYDGALDFGPERIEQLNENWKDSVTEKVEKAAPITSTRPRARRVKVSLSKALTKVLAESGDATAVSVEKALAKLGKAEEDPKISADRIAQAIADGLTFDELLQIEQLIQDELGDFTAESAKLAIDALGVKPDDGLTNRVFDRAVAWVKERGAELVSVDGDESLISSTRNMVRSIVADGLEQNIGTDAIAEAIQESAAFSEDRAKTIANYETAKANEEGKGAGWREAQADGLEITKGSQTSAGSDTCDECLENEAEGLIPLDQAFSSGDDFAPFHVKCECATFAVATDPNDGTETETDES